MRTSLLALALAGAVVAVFPAAAHAGDCSRLMTAVLPDVTIESATDVPEGPFRGDSGFAPPTTVPDLCRVRGVIRPTPQSDIRFEVWLPKSWNGKFQGVGNGGFAGSIGYRPGLVEAARQGYAAASTDTGHVGDAGTSAWARNQPEKIVDYGHRAIHLTTTAAKALVALYYGRGPAYSYFASCSNGGRQGLMEAQRYPDDYDGIIAGAPAYDFTGVQAGFGWNARALARPGAAIPPEMTSLIEAAVLRQCDKIDGVADGVVADPRLCRFDARVLLCSKDNASQCLSAPQVKALEAIYSGARGVDGRQVYPGWSPGGQAGQFPGFGWEGWMFSASPTGNSQIGLLRGFMRDFLIGDSTWDVDRYDVARDPARARERLGSVLDAKNPDLGRFWRRGGKLILFHGWSDPAIAPQSTINYFEAVRGKMGARASDAGMRLFMVPGMQHCFAGPGATSFGGLMAPQLNDPTRDMSAALELWVEQGKAPEQLIATRYENPIQGIFDPAKAKSLSTGLLCAYPKKARWTGKGSPSDAANYACARKS